MREIFISKFGGGVLHDKSSFPQLFTIVKEEKPTIVVVSAFGGTTTALMDFALGCKEGDINLQKKALEKIHGYHDPILKYLYLRSATEAFEARIERLKKFAKDKSNNCWPIIFDTISAIGEITASEVVSDFLNAQGLPNVLMTASEFIRTDMNFGSANILKKESIEKIQNGNFTSHLTQGKMIVIPGYLGYAIEQGAFTFRGYTTLGREGSDYTAGLVANMVSSVPGFDFHVREVTLWKDVDGVANHDPKEKSEKPLHFFSALSYKELREEIQPGGIAEGLVHPKTIGELEEKEIPLRIRNFWNLKNPGTRIRVNLDPQP
jgi:aspartate kinase